MSFKMVVLLESQVIPLLKAPNTRGYGQIRQFYDRQIGLFIPGVLFNNVIGIGVSLNPLMLVLPVYFGCFKRYILWILF